MFSAVPRQRQFYQGEHVVPTCASIPGALGLVGYDRFHYCHQRTLEYGGNAFYLRYDKCQPRNCTNNDLTVGYVPIYDAFVFTLFGELSSSLSLMYVYNSSFWEWIYVFQMLQSVP